MPGTSLLKRLSLHHDSLRRRSSKDNDRSIVASHNDSTESSLSPPPAPPLQADLLTSTPSSSLAASGGESRPLEVASPPRLADPSTAGTVAPKPLPPSPLPSSANAPAPHQTIDGPLAQVWRGLDGQETAMKPGKVDSAVSALVTNGSASFVSLPIEGLTLICCSDGVWGGGRCGGDGAAHRQTCC
jgi:hypothetical protein